MLLLLDFGVEVLLCCSESVGVLENWSSSEESALSVLGSGSFVPFFFPTVLLSAEGAVLGSRILKVCWLTEVKILLLMLSTICLRFF